MKEKHIFAAIIVVLSVMICLFTLGMLFAGTGQDRYRISVIISDSGSSEWVPFKAGLDQAAADNQVDLNYLTTGNIDSLETQRNLIEEEINDGADAVIVEFCKSESTQKLVSEISRRVPMILIGTPVKVEADVSNDFAYIGQDNYNVGRAVGNEVVIHYGKSLQRMNIGVISGNQNQTAMQERLQGLKDAVKNYDVNINWEVSGKGNMVNRIAMTNERMPVHILVALDNDGIEAAADYINTDAAINAPIFGVGVSEKNAYFVDTGAVVSMVVPHDFNMGYDSITELVSRLDMREAQLKDKIGGYSIINKTNLFKEENQKLLFPLVQ